MADQRATILRASGVRKRFGGSEALRGVDFSVSTGEIVGLVGENGAGKSTLVKVLTGVHVPSTGSLQLDGEDVTFGSPRVAAERGVAVVHQDSQLFPSLRVWENLAITSGRIPGPGPFVSRPEARRAAVRVLDRFATRIDPDARVRALLPIERRLVEIARALAAQPSFLLLDEPTAALERSESRRLLDMLRELRDQGTGLVLVSHHLDEVEALADRVTVLRDGAVSAELRRGEFDHGRMIEAMLGHSLVDGGVGGGTAGRPAPSPEVSIAIRQLRVLPTAQPVDVTVRRGELVAVTGLVGSGTSSFLEHLVGGGPARSAGISVAGRPVSLASPAAALRAGVGFLSQDRKRSGALPNHSVSWNVGLAALPLLCRNGFRRSGRIDGLARDMRDRLGVRCASVGQDMRTLSGGNQQKVLIARWLATGVKILAIDEPSQGVDIGARADIADHLRHFAAQGGTVVFASSDLYEIRDLATRVIVLHRGDVIADLDVVLEPPSPEALLAIMSSSTASPADLDVGATA